jgi:hypothetical protein
VRPLPATLLVLAAATAAGCPAGDAWNRAGVPQPAPRVDRLDLYSSPMALNWDDRPGADGVGAQVYFWRAGEELPVTAGGTLELAIYEGNVPPADLGGKKALRTWRFGGEELVAYCARNIIGWHYAMPLGWGEDVPRSDMVTLIARYRGADGRLLQSRPTTIPMKR